MFADDKSVHCFLILISWAVKILVRIPLKQYTAKTSELNYFAPVGI
jgi:hypothetical protein